ncbi:hypothetical protein SLNWT_0159 [Streptomyces albus]|uniref:3-keto-5-aminohexanoate cleavage protein n=1 Tax=Streptomyces albus (strain ATCC 21838 / DSM 41398 / FERM P-419 / JCM 4703 / NBRC 107858) TaxID=1081613 RepID=A0A0B5EMF7_STRA4|nr:hypothetical protein SLNWT_0159 [Streptomyces albus]AOU74852.1 hypothetical protein SLNHY_0161 [Streptomyces albus]AYN30661.1 hypothetical protein DUI70_0158 [Streptomyces albus]
MEPLVIVLNPNENTPRRPNPHVPFTAQEIAADVAACVDAGAGVIHFHARAANGDPQHSARAYAEVTRAIRERCDVLLAPSLANGPGFTLERRLAPALVADAKPDFVVIDAGCAATDLYDLQEHAFRTDDRVLVNDTATVRQLLAAARRLGSPPWFASFTIGWTRTIGAHLDSEEASRGRRGPAIVQLVLGGPEFLPAHPATRAGLEAHLAFLPESASAWVVSAHRADVLAVAPEVIRRGGHVAIGVGDHPHVERGLPTNAELVAEVAGVARRLGRDLAGPAEARHILGLPTRDTAHPRLREDRSDVARH